VDELALADFKSDYNIFWNSVPGTVVQFNNVNFDTIEDFRTATGNEEQGIGVDPRFIDVSRSDLRVAADSPAIDSADATADGFQSIDHNGFPPSDDPTVEDAGRGSVAYADRGAFENDPAPTVALEVTPPIGSIDLSVEADASLSRTYEGTVVSRFSFDFGDGTLIGPQLSPIADHTYSSPGNYKVTVYATDRATASASAIVSALDRPPSVVLTLTPNPKNPQIVTVDASHSTDDDSTPIVSYLFSFGDGTTLGPQASPVTVHKYKSKGFFRIEVTVSDSAGKSSAAAAVVNTRDRFSNLRFAAATAPRLRTRTR
jgi:PKD repeat protein